jgi:CDP-6-deoxy-D-xylo-4-hexulose-3-dehydrase
VRYPLATNSWGPEEEAALQAVIADGRYSMGPRTREFERAFAAYLGVRHCVMVSSGSTANLLMAAALLYRGADRLVPGDEVVVPAVGWSTTYFPFSQAGFQLRFVDVDPATLNIDPAALEEAVTPATRAVCTVNVLGNPTDFEAVGTVLRTAERRHGRPIALLEDNCESLGAVYGDRQCGTLGLMGTFSFFFSHHMSTMEGGAVCTDDDELAEILTCLRAHGWTRNLPETSILVGRKHQNPFHESFRFVLPGYNVRPLEMSAAVGLRQLEKLPRFIATRRRNAERLQERLAPLAGRVTTQQEIGRSSWFGFSLLVEPAAGRSRDDVVAVLADAEIECRPIVTGNFARQEALRWIDHTVAGPLEGADRVHDHGLFVGNGERDLSGEIDHLATTLTRAVGLENPAPVGAGGTEGA